MRSRRAALRAGSGALDRNASFHDACSPTPHTSRHQVRNDPFADHRRMSAKVQSGFPARIIAVGGRRTFDRIVLSTLGGV